MIEDNDEKINKLNSSTRAMSVELDHDLLVTLPAERCHNLDRILICFVAVVAGDWLYIDGGEFSFMSNGTPQFQYGARHAGRLIQVD